MRESVTLLTVGHSNHALDHFLDLLESANVQAIADVRSWPRSRHAPQYNSEALKDALTGRRIRYVFLGDELGGRPEDHDLYDPEGHVLYDRVAATELFAGGMQRLLTGAREMRVAVMCTEENPTHCHRRLLVARVALERHGADVLHVRGDARVEQEPGFSTRTDERLFGELEETPWRSTQSVLRRRTQSISSAA